MRTLDARRRRDRATGLADVHGLCDRLAPARAATRRRRRPACSAHPGRALRDPRADRRRSRARGERVAARFRALGLDDVRIDDVGNVLGARAGAERRGARASSARTSTPCFPTGRRVGVRARRIAARRARASSTTARGLAGDARPRRGDRRRARCARGGPILFAATVGEEGVGDLRGAKHLFARARPRAGVPASPSTARATTASSTARSARAASASPSAARAATAGRRSASPNPVHAAGAAAARARGAAAPAHAAHDALGVPHRRRHQRQRDPRGSVARDRPALDVRATCSRAMHARDPRGACAPPRARRTARRAPGTAPLTFDDRRSIGDRPCGETAARSSARARRGRGDAR